MRLGLVLDGGDQFLRPIEGALSERYQVARFVPRFMRAPVVGSSANKVLLHLQLATFLRRHDLVFFEWAGPLLARATQMRKRCRLVTRLHSFEVAAWAQAINWSQVDGTIVVSQHMRQRFLQVTGAMLSSIHVVNYGVDLARFKPVVRPFGYRLVMVCSVLPIKRVYEAVLCLAELRGQGHPFALDVVGAMGGGQSPRYPWALRELVAKLGLTEVVTFHGQLDNVPDLLAGMDVFLSNSYWEGQQNALLEAMACGCYCLAHCWGGVEEVLPAENIFVTDAELRSKLVTYARLPETQRLDARALMRSIAEEKFDQQRMVRQILDVVESVGSR